MSILSYIKDPIPLIIIGGMSGIGKTSIIDSLFSDYPNTFLHPKSFTTRPKRNEADRYEFISKEKIFSMFDNGELLNIDKVHNEYYGIDIAAIDEIKALGKIPIKEIHPKNFYKFKIKGLNTINILIENKHLKGSSVPFIKRENREEDIFDFGGYAGYDIRLNIAGLTIKESAEILIKRLFSFRLDTFTLPHPSFIEEFNKNGYNKIAFEFYDEFRITTKNFHESSRGFWKKTLKEFIESPNRPLNILELGPGNGWLLENAKYKGHTLYGLEISENMEAKYCNIVFNSSVRNIPTKANFFDVVIGSLIDPLLSCEAFVEIERVLKPKGVFIFTMPSSEWARNLEERKKMNQTTFKTKLGDDIAVFSFCDFLYRQPSIQSFSTLKIISVESLYLGDGYPNIISDAIKRSAENAQKPVLYFPIVVGAIFQKDDDI